MKPAGFILRFIGFKCEKMSQRVILHSKDFPYSVYTKTRLGSAWEIFVYCPCKWPKE